MDIIRLDDPRYPPLLKETVGPPPSLYIRGEADLLTRTDAIAIVGTRKLTRYGEAATRLLARELAEAGIPIVSGLALGIDAVAHEATLDAGGTTIAVLAAGVTDGDINPRTNFALAQRILKNGGAIISELPPGTAAHKGMFPRRNRIIAGMCCATIVVEAATKSGALITGRLALEMGREVFAVPGPITSPSSEGANLLLAEGAAPALSAAFIMEELGMRQLRGLRESSAAGPAGIAAAAQARARQDLTDVERDVMGAIDGGWETPDDIAEKTGLPARIVSATLVSLSLKGISRN